MCRPYPGGVRTLIALHHGRIMKGKSFLFCRGRVNISGGSKIAWINVECNGDSLSVAVPSKVFAVLRNSCYSSVTNLLLRGNWRDSEKIETAALPKNLFIWQQLLLQPMAVCIISNSRVIEWGIDPWHANVLQWQRPSNIRTIFHVIHLKAKKRDSRKKKPYASQDQFVTLNV